MCLLKVWLLVDGDFSSPSSLLSVSDSRTMHSMCVCLCVWIPLGCCLVIDFQYLWHVGWLKWSRHWWSISAGAGWQGWRGTKSLSFFELLFSYYALLLSFKLVDTFSVWWRIIWFYHQKKLTVLIMLLYLHNDNYSKHAPSHTQELTAHVISISMVFLFSHLSQKRQTHQSVGHFTSLNWLLKCFEHCSEYSSRSCVVDYL